MKHLSCASAAEITVRCVEWPADLEKGGAM